MSITADPLFVAAEVDYRRQSLQAGLPYADRSGRHHAWILRLAARPRRNERHAAPRAA
jgi:hypothetical protein